MNHSSDSLSAAQIWGLFLATLLLLTLRLLEFAVSGAGLHVDEAQYWFWSQSLEWGYFSKPPVLVALIQTSTTLFGDSVLGVKALAMVCWLLSSWVLGLLAYRMAGARVAVLAGVLLASTLISGLLGLSVTTDAPLTLFWVLSMWTLWEAAHQPGKRAVLWWVACGLSLGLAVLSKYSALAMGVSALLLLWMCPPKQRARVFKGGLWAIGTMTLVVLPHLLWNMNNGWPTLQHTIDITVGRSEAASVHMSGQMLHSLRSGAEFVLGQLLILGPSVLLMAWWVWQRRRRHTSMPVFASLSARMPRVALWSVSAYAWAFSAPILLLGLVQALRAKALINWAVPMAIGVCLWLAWLARQRQMQIRHLVWIALPGLLLSAIIATAGDLKSWVGIQTPAGKSKWDIWSRMRGWDETLLALKPALKDHREIPWVFSSRAALVHTAYALRDVAPKGYSFNPDGQVHHHFDWKHSYLSVNQQPALVWIATEGPSADLLQSHPDARLLAKAQSGRVALQAWLLQTKQVNP